ncbi:MAG: clostripain-related cysteine peptidase [Proteiniphilum sp.]|nr:clostripain-related cysteine peptidase [Proteiniphilum sp.]
MRIKNILLSVGLFFMVFLVSCEKDDTKPLSPHKTEQTLFMYMPWSSNLTTHFEQNLKNFETTIENNILGNNRVIVFFSSSPTEATLFELKNDGGNCIRKIFKSYQNPAFTTANGITSILNDVKTIAPANRYAMVVSSHGTGWLPVTPVKTLRAVEKFHWEYECEGVPLTRFFGGLSPEYQTNVKTFAEGITNAGLKMEFILFDDCYMSGVEVAYDLKGVTNYLIASPTEVMAYGFPYHIIGEHLVNNNYYAICKGFYDYYKNDQYPYGTIGLINCREVDNLTAIMREINQRFTFAPELLNSVQRLDGYSPVIFFDYGDYVSKLCADKKLLTRFESQLERTVPKLYRMHTQSYYSMIIGEVNIDTFSGITISDPSMNAQAITTKTETAWYKATH